MLKQPHLLEIHQTRLIGYHLMQSRNHDHKQIYHRNQEQQASHTGSWHVWCLWMFTVYNDNKACIDWSDSAANKCMKHMNLKKKFVYKAHHKYMAKVTYISSIINASDIFTKELRDGAHFLWCHDTICFTYKFQALQSCCSQPHATQARPSILLQFISHVTTCLSRANCLSLCHKCILFRTPYKKIWSIATGKLFRFWFLSGCCHEVGW